MKDDSEQQQQQRKQHYTLFKNLVELYPTLGHVCSPEKLRKYCLPDDIQHQLNLNRCGWKLLRSTGGDDTSRRESIPIALWPIVLSQVKHKIDHCGLHYERMEKEASVLYSILRQGPILLDRATNTVQQQQQASDNKNQLFARFSISGGRKRKATQC